jgi:hypothetical protein
MAALADLVAVVHGLFAVFVVGGLFVLAAGIVFGGRGGRWARHPGFRLAHLAAVLFVAARAWLGLPCPLTWLEDHLRANDGGGRSALVRQAHAAAFRGEDPERFRAAAALWALASVSLALFPVEARSLHGGRGLSRTGEGRPDAGN